MAKKVGTIKCVRDLTSPSVAVRKVLEADEKRRAKFDASPYDWNRPLFDSPFEQRRLRLLDTLCQALSRHGGKLEIGGGEGRDLRFKIGDQWIDAALDHPSAKPDRWGRHTVQAGPSGLLKLELKVAPNAGVAKTAWTDGDGTKLETCLSEILVFALVSGEAKYRLASAAHHKWEVERRERLAAERVRAQQEAERRELERLEQEAQARRDILFIQASAWRQARDLRAFVAEVSEWSGATVPVDLASWSSWALVEADQIDPLKNGSLIASAGTLLD